MPGGVKQPRVVLSPIRSGERQQEKETKGLTLEQVDRMMEECGSPRKSPGWTPHSTYAAEMGLTQDGKLPVEAHNEKAGADQNTQLVAGTKALNEVHHNEASNIV
ncbi:hypothetical protein IAU59_005972 [Kwoniella sp. CBS 9459]